MKAAIISDVHANLEALHVVLKDIKKRRLKSIFCLGDLVGYGANPNECIDLCLKESKVVVAGNHDWAAVEKTDIASFNPVAAEAIRWTRQKLDPEVAKKLKGLELARQVDNLVLVHATPADPAKWGYLLSLDEFEREFSHFRGQICFIGHSHVPVAVYQDDNGYCDLVRDNPFPIVAKRRYIVNVGSVGQPRDMDPRASYAIYDGNNNAIEIIRLDYNIPLAQQKIVLAGLPEVLADRLLAGR